VEFIRLDMELTDLANERLIHTHTHTHTHTRARARARARNYASS